MSTKTKIYQYLKGEKNDQALSIQQSLDDLESSSITKKLSLSELLTYKKAKTGLIKVNCLNENGKEVSLFFECVD